MGKEFEKLAQVLTKKNISLVDFEGYLKYCELNKFNKLTETLKKQNIELQNYKEYLEKYFVASSVITSTPIKKNLNYSKRELTLIKEVGFNLLDGAKISLQELNSFLKEFSPEELNLKELLKKFLARRIINIEEFLDFCQGKWKKIDKNLCFYGFKANENNPTFYLEKQKGNKRFGNYEIIEELGKGGNGIVYKAYHQDLNQFFALKVLRLGASASERTQQRFQREIKMMARLKHPGIVQILDSGHKEDEYYFVMEFVDGQPLNKLIQQKRSVRESIQLIQKILASLSKAHLLNIIHRDLKPANILITKEGEPKIADFGLAKQIISARPVLESQKLTHSGAILGTINYMSPEQAMGKTHELDERSDIYSIGVCLYELLTHQCPLQDELLQRQLDKVIHEEPLAPSILNPAIHQDLDTILLKSLEKDPVQRYQTVQDFSADLKRFMEGYPILAKPKSAKEKFFKWMKRNASLTFFLGIIILLSVSFSLWLYSAEYYFRFSRLQNAFQLAINEREIAEKIVSHNFEARGRKFKHLIRSLNAINQALLLKVDSSKIEREKLKTVTACIELACQNKEFELARLLAIELQTLHFYAEEKKNLFATIKKAKERLVKKHLHEFSFWIKRLKEGTLHPRELEDALFAISKMPEPEIFQKLIQYLEEGIFYFLTRTTSNSTKETFYNTIVSILNRQENSQSEAVLLMGFKKIGKKITRYPLQQRPHQEVQFLILLAEALGNIKSKKTIPYLAQLRFIMGVNSLFGKKTNRCYQQLLQLGPLKPAKKIRNSQEKLEFQAYQKFITKKYHEAISLYTKLLSTNSVNAQYYYYLGTARESIGDFDQALLDLTNALTIDPRDHGSYLSRGNVKKSMGDIEGAIQDFNATLVLDPGNLDAYNNRGVAFFDLKMYDRAISDYNKAIQLDPQYIDGYLNRASSKVEKKDFKGAIQDCNHVLSLDPRYVFAYINRGGCKVKLGDLDGAIQDFDQALEINSQYAEAYNNRGNAKKRKKDLQGALQDFNEALRLKPNYLDALYGRSSLLFHFKKLKKALIDFDRIIILAPKEWDSYFARGNIKAMLDDYHGAITDFDHVLRLNPAYYKAYGNRGGCKLFNKDYKGAIIDFDKLLQLFPDVPGAYLNRGIAKFHLKKVAQAKEDFLKFLELAQQDLSEKTNEDRAWIFERYPELKEKK